VGHVRAFGVSQLGCVPHLHRLGLGGGGGAGRVGLGGDVAADDVIGAEFEEALGVKVVVGTPNSLRERLHDEVLAEAVASRSGSSNHVVATLRRWIRTPWRQRSCLCGTRHSGG